MISNIEFFDYFSGFISIADQMLDYINNQMLVFMICGYEDCKETVKDQQWVFDGDTNVSIEMLYDIENKRWK